MKKAILAASVGTTLAESDQSCIRPIEDALQVTFSDRHIFRAFTSRLIRQSLSEQGMHVDSVEEAIARITSKGYEDLVIAATHIIPGTEYDRLLAAAQRHKVSAPLLADSDDLDWMADLLGAIAANEGCPLLMMGHGSDHAADETYAQLRRRLPKNVFLGCLKGEHTLEALFPTLRAARSSEIMLMPLMLTAGTHALRDLAGDGKHSWKSILEARGFRVHARLQGLGALSEVQQCYVKKVEQCL